MSIFKIKENSTTGTVLNILSVIPFAGAAITAIAAITMFIINKGFGKQIELLKAGWWDALTSQDNVWTLGTCGYFYNMWSVIAAGALLIALGIFAAIELYRYGSAGKKIVFSVSGILLVPALALTVISFIREINLVLSFVSLGISVVSGIICLVLLSGEDYFKRFIFAAVCFFAAAPLIVLIIENIIGIAAFIILLALIGIGCLIFGAASGSGSGSSSYSGSSSNSGSGSHGSTSREAKKKQNRIAELQNDIRKSERNLEGYYNKEFSYGSVDPKYWSKRAAKAREELRKINEK